VFWASDGTLFGSSARRKDCYCWRIHPATNAFMPPRLERMPLHKPARFESLCTSSNLVAWTTTRGSRVDALEHITESHGHWESTIRGVGAMSSDGRWLAIYTPFTPNVSVYRIP